MSGTTGTSTYQTGDLNGRSGSLTSTDRRPSAVLGFDAIQYSSPTSNTQQQLSPTNGRHASIGGRSDSTPRTGAEASTTAEKSEDSSIPPPWTELKTKAGKERKRLPLACIACRRKKIRCSGEHPACKHCLRSRIPCVYKVTTRKAAPRTDYMAMLDKRLKRMEDRVIKIIPKDEQGIVISTGRAIVKPTPPAQPQRTSSGKKRAAEQTLEDLENWSKAKKMHIDVQAQPGGMRTHELDEQTLMHEGADKLPSKEIQEHLAEVFFEYVYGQSYHLLHKPSFMRRLSQGDIAPVLSLAVCAMAARFSDHPTLKTEPAFLRGEEWAIAAREISLKRFDSPNITVLIVYLILTLHEFGTCQGSRSWMFAGMAQRMAYAMQLHHDLARDPCLQNTSHNGELSYTDREIRRRTMWACFMTDRFTSSGTERPTFINIDHLQLQLPTLEDYFQMELTGPTEDLSGKVLPSATPEDQQVSNAKDNMGVAAYMIRMVAIWGNCINYYNMGGKAKEQHPMWDERSTFNSLRKSIRAWKSSLPDRLLYRPDNLATHASQKIANQFIFMHIIYHQTSLFVNRFALPLVASRTSADASIPKNFIQDSAKSALNAANCISTLVHDGMNYNVVAPFAGYSAFFSSTVHIQGAFSNNEALVAASNKFLTWNISYLSKMKRHWGMFHFMIENLRELYRKHANAARSTGALDKGNDTIFQYGDWFDRYPHGVSGADYEEPQSTVKKEPGADAGMGQRSDLQTVEDFFSSKPSPQTQAVSRHKARKNSRKSIVETDLPTAQAQPEQLSQLQLPHINDLYGQVDTQSDVIASPIYPGGYSQGPPFPAQLNNAYIDRATALSAYADFDTSSIMQFAMPGMSYDPLLNMGIDSAIGMTDANGQAAYQAAASGGWFMPLNLDAAAIAEASGPFSTGTLDYSDQFDLTAIQNGVPLSQARLGINGNPMEPG